MKDFKWINFVFIMRIFQILQAFLITTIVIKYFTIKDQGLYYVFTSVIGIQGLLDNGLGGVINKYVLKYSSVKKFESELKILYSISSTIYLILTLISIIILLCVGVYIFRKQDFATTLFLVLALLFNALTFYFVFIKNFLDSTNHINVTQKAQIILGSLSILFFFFFTKFNIGINVLFFVNLFNAISIIILYRYLINKIDLTKGFRIIDINFQKSVDFVKRNRSLFFRNAISFLSGYIMFQFFTILVFQLRGEEDAGRVGLSFQFYQVVTLISTSILYKNTPLLSYIVEARKISSLNHVVVILIRSTIKFAVLMSLFLVIFIFFVRFLISDFDARVIELPYFFVLLFTAIIMNISHVLTAVVRLRTYEPFTFISILVAAVLTFSNWLILKGSYNVGCVFVSFFLLMFFLLIPYTIYVYRQFVKTL